MSQDHSHLSFTDVALLGYGARLHADRVAAANQAAADRIVYSNHVAGLLAQGYDIATAHSLVQDFYDEQARLRAQYEEALRRQRQENALHRRALRWLRRWWQDSADDSGYRRPRAEAPATAELSAAPEGSTGQAGLLGELAVVATVEGLEELLGHLDDLLRAAAEEEPDLVTSVQLLQDAAQRLYGVLRAALDSPAQQARQAAVVQSQRTSIVLDAVEAELARSASEGACALLRTCGTFRQVVEMTAGLAARSIALERGA